MEGDIVLYFSNYWQMIKSNDYRYLRIRWVTVCTQCEPWLDWSPVGTWENMRLWYCCASRALFGPCRAGSIWAGEICFASFDTKFWRLCWYTLLYIRFIYLHYLVNILTSCLSIFFIFFTYYDGSIYFMRYQRDVGAYRNAHFIRGWYFKVKN